MALQASVRRPAYRLYQLAWTGLDWLYPPQCGGCGRQGTRWCLECQRSTEVIQSSCQRCGQPLTETGLCYDCQATPPPYHALRSWAVFNGPLRNAMHRLKYQGDVALGEVLARPLIQMLRELSWEADFVTAVPIGVARRAQRGYNQAALLALPLALGSGLRYRPRALRKQRETRTQVGLTVVQRRENVAQAYQANSKLVKEKRVLGVDDITTSGATIEACAMALIQAGASQVYGLTLAHAATQFTG